MNNSFIRFAVVGVINTAVYYLFYLSFIFLTIPYVASHVMAFLISMVGSFFLNCYFTYRTKPTWKKFLAFPLTNVVNFVISTGSLYVIVDWLHMSKEWAPIISMFLPIPFTYLTSKWILTNKKDTPI